MWPMTHLSRWPVTFSFFPGKMHIGALQSWCSQSWSVCSKSALVTVLLHETSYYNSRCSSWGALSRGNLRTFLVVSCSREYHDERQNVPFCLGKSSSEMWGENADGWRTQWVWLTSSEDFLYQICFKGSKLMSLSFLNVILWLEQATEVVLCLFQLKCYHS